MTTTLKIQRIDSRQADVRQVLDELRERLSPRGNVVSEASRQRTIDVFGEPLSASQVVERICHDVQSRGMAAVLDYSARLDKAELTAGSLRVPAADLVAAHRAADPEIAGNGAADQSTHSGIPTGHLAPRRHARTARRQSAQLSAICRSTGSAFVFPAVPPPIRRRC